MNDLVIEIYHIRKSNYKNVRKARKNFVLLKYIPIFIEIITKTLRFIRKC